MAGQELNWAGNHRYAAQRLVRPHSISELCAVVAENDKVRALGSRHSFSDLADTEGTLVSLLGLPVDVEVDSASATVRVSAGATYGDLSTALHGAGWALPSMASLPHITVAGAVATGTHGSGDGLGSLSSAVRAIELVGPDGDLRSVAAGDPLFDGHVVALGALGVVTHLTLAIEPTFEVRQDVLVGLAWEDLTEHLDTIMGSAYSVSVFTDWVSPEANQVWLKSRTAGRPDLPGVLGRSLPATEPTHMLRGGEVEALTAQLGEAGPWHERLPHFRMEFTPSRGAELQSEYFVARRDAPAACASLLRLGGRLAPLLQVSEIRSVASEQLWLSGAYDEDVVGFHFTWVLDPRGVGDVLPLVEEALHPFAARAHWGKCFTLPSSRIREVHPRLGDFTELRDVIDPGLKFDNAFLQRCLG